MKNPFKSEPVTIRYVICPKHGEHDNVVMSVIKGHEGTWCMLCMLEMLGPSLPYELRTEDEK